MPQQRPGLPHARLLSPNGELLALLKASIIFYVSLFSYLLGNRT